MRALRLASFACTLAWAVGANATLPLATGTIGAGGSGCPTSALATSACLLATITNTPNGVVDGVSTAVADKTASLKVTEPSGSLLGTAVLFPGGDGNAWYENQYSAAVSAWMTGASVHWRIVQVNWTSPGWDNGSVGPRSLAARTEAVLNAIHANSGYSFYSAGTRYVAIGHSAGSSQIAYAIATYGAGSYIDMAIFTSGPPHSRVDWNCYGGLIAAWQAVGPALCTTGSVIQISSANWANIEISYNSRTRCRGASITGGLDNEGERDSIYRSDATLIWLQTDVRAIYGDGDGTAAVPLGRWFIRQLTPHTAYVETITTGGITHNNVPGSTDGAAAITAALAAATFNH